MASSSICSSHGCSLRCYASHAIVHAGLRYCVAGLLIHVLLNAVSLILTLLLWLGCQYWRCLGMYGMLRVEWLLRRCDRGASAWMLPRVWISTLNVTLTMTMLSLRRLLILRVLHHLYCVLPREVDCKRVECLFAGAQDMRPRGIFRSWYGSERRKVW